MNFTKVNIIAPHVKRKVGIRLLTLTAKAVARRGGKLALVGPNPEVHRVLEVTGIPEAIPVYAQFESAEAVLLGS